MNKQTLIQPKSKIIILTALALASALCLGLYGMRALYTERLSYFFLNWNLFLAWIPMICAVAAYRLYARRSQLSYLAVPAFMLAWLLFFPNAPYMTTDLLHLRSHNSIPVWFDLIMLLSYAWTAFLLGIVSLYLMQDLVSQTVGGAGGWVFVLLTLGLTGFGIYLGRFLNWNSWDVFTNPYNLIADILDRLRHPFVYRGAFAFSFLFSAFSLSAYLVLFALTRLSPQGQPAK
ncbi:MAG: DUF1361 domain-containing protein [Anaerolineales bacterium]